MKTVGIISEYNPFHNGHRYHIEVAKKTCNADNVICIMSGNFVQRGEPAIFDKWSRAEMAIRSGADLVLELPFVYACQPAEIFALGAVKILNDINIVDYLCFGSELGELPPLNYLAKLLGNEPEDLKSFIKEYMSKGFTYPKAVALSLKDYLKSTDYSNIHQVINKPNNILGIEYIKAINLLKSTIKPVAIKRVVSDYNDKKILDSISSATSIRIEILNNGVSDMISYSMPSSSVQIINELINNNIHPVFLSDLSDILLYKLRSISIDEMLSFMNIVEGIENRIKKFATSSTNIIEFIEKCKTKRYTRTFIQRLLCHLLINLKYSDITRFKNIDCPSYARVLALNEKGKGLIKKIKKNEDYPIITKTANFTTNSTELRKMFDFDILSSDIYSLTQNCDKYKKGGADYYTSPIIIK